jgi:hypothetical protein
MSAINDNEQQARSTTAKNLKFDRIKFGLTLEHGKRNAFLATLVHIKPSVGKQIGFSRTPLGQWTRRH